MGQALYRKYRPRKFSETVGQEAVTKTLSEAIKSGRLSHAYLFAGPRGVGKTSIARILAHEVNQLPYSDDSIHLDIIEIDAASNRRIDEIRDLREKVHIAPTSAKYKVYIIDEVHMLTKEAFNALLKTLEEPPPHCIFILATTEAHKLPETIISRTQRFNFKPVGTNPAGDRIKKIAADEKIDIDEAALVLLAEFGEGSLRDTIGLLDQLGSSSKKVGENDVREMLGIPSDQSIDKLLREISAGRPKEVLECIDVLKEQATSPAAAAKAISKTLRQRLIEGGESEPWVTNLLKELLGVASSGRPQEVLELAVLEAASRKRSAGPNVSGGSRSPVEKPAKKPSAAAAAPKAVTTESRHPQIYLEKGQWQEVLGRVKAAAPSLYTALRLAETEVEDNRLILRFRFPLHQKKVKEAKHAALISKLLEETSGAKMAIECIVDKDMATPLAEKSPPAESARESHELNSISNIFGSAEVLES